MGSLPEAVSFHHKGLNHTDPVGVAEPGRRHLGREKESLFRVAGRSYIMVQKEESVEGLRNKNSLRLIGAQSGGGVCRQPGGQQGHQETQAGAGVVVVFWQGGGPDTHGG